MTSKLFVDQEKDSIQEKIHQQSVESIRHDSHRESTLPIVEQLIYEPGRSNSHMKVKTCRVHIDQPRVQV